MRFLSHLTLAILLALSTVTSAFAAKKDKTQRDPVAGFEKKLQKADLPTEVRAKASKVLAEHGPKVRAAHTASEAVLTSEQKSARAAALKAAKEAGTKRKQIEAEVAKALKLTDEQKTKYAAAQREFAAAQSAMQSELKNVLTADQQTKVGLKNKKKKNA